MWGLQTADGCIWQVPPCMVKAAPLFFATRPMTVGMKMEECMLLTMIWSRPPSWFLEPVGHTLRLDTVLKAMALAEHMGLPMPRALRGFNALLIIACHTHIEAPSRQSLAQIIYESSVRFAAAYPMAFRKIEDPSVPAALMWACEQTQSTPRHLLGIVLGSDVRRVDTFVGKIRNKASQTT